MTKVTVYKTEDGKLFENEELAKAHEEENKKHKYDVTLNFVGTWCATIHAKDEKEAIEIADNAWYADDVSLEIESADVREC